MSDFEKGKIAATARRSPKCEKLRRKRGRKMILKELLKVASGTLVELEIEEGDMILRTETLAEVMMRNLNEEKKELRSNKTWSEREDADSPELRDEGKAYSDKRATWGWRK